MQDHPIPSRRVYELPEFVLFSHRAHSTAEVECSKCHGAVMEQETVKLQQPLKMKWCVDCHKQNKAAVSCNLCHELGQ
jgi:c(7)-type cytochrome triheme protein